MLREQGSSCGFTGPAGAAEAASMLGFYYQRQSSQEASVSVSIIGGKARVAYADCVGSYPNARHVKELQAEMRMLDAHCLAAAMHSEFVCAHQHLVLCRASAMALLSRAPASLTPRQQMTGPTTRCATLLVRQGQLWQPGCRGMLLGLSS